MKVRLRQDMFSRWIIVHPDDDNLAWSGSRWVAVTAEGLPIDVQVSNFDSEQAAREYAPIYGFTVHTYKISDDGKSITCLGCGMTSWNSNDVEQHFCGHCKIFHDDLWPPAREWWIHNTPKVHNDRTTRAS